MVFLARSRLISYVSGASGKTQLAAGVIIAAALISIYLHRVSFSAADVGPYFSRLAGCLLPFLFEFFNFFFLRRRRRRQYLRQSVSWQRAHIAIRRLLSFIIFQFSFQISAHF